MESNQQWFEIKGTLRILRKIIHNLISKIHNIFTTHFTKGCLIYPLITADGGVADVLQHVQINVLTNSDCSWRWLFQSILSTHICVGGGTESACNVSTLYIILFIFDQELIFLKLFLDYCFFSYFLFFFSVLASRVTPVALLFARRTASGSWRV